MNRKIVAITYPCNIIFFLFRRFLKEEKGRILGIKNYNSILTIARLLLCCFTILNPFFIKEDKTPTHKKACGTLSSYGTAGYASSVLIFFFFAKSTAPLINCCERPMCRNCFFIKKQVMLHTGLSSIRLNALDFSNFI